MIRNFDSFVQEAMPYRIIDRSVVRTRDIMLNDGNAYDIYDDPMKVATMKMWSDAVHYQSPVEANFRASAV